MRFFLTGLSAVSAAISAMFWSWILGPVGVFAATPLTMRLVVVSVREAIATIIETLNDR